MSLISDILSRCTLCACLPLEQDSPSRSRDRTGEQLGIGDSRGVGDSRPYQIIDSGGNIRVVERHDWIVRDSESLDEEDDLMAALVRALKPWPALVSDPSFVRLSFILKPCTRFSLSFRPRWSHLVITWIILWSYLVITWILEEISLFFIFVLSYFDSFSLGLFDSSSGDGSVGSVGASNCRPARQWR